MRLLARIRRSADAFAATLLTLFDGCGRLDSVTAALAISAVWIVPMAIVKLRLLNHFILTSDIATYETILHNTGFDFSDRSFLFLNSYNSDTFLTEHFAPTFALVSPLQWLIPHPIFLVILQPLLIALAGVGIWKVSRLVLERYGAPQSARWLPLLFQVVYLFNYSTISATADTIYGFHHDSLIPPLMVWALACVLQSRWRLSAVLLVLLLGVKENIPIILAAFFAACLPLQWLMPRRAALTGIVACAIFFGGCYLFEFNSNNVHVNLVFQYLDRSKLTEAWGWLPAWSGFRFFWPGLLAIPFALPAVGELSLQLMGHTIELDWHSFPLMTLAVISTMFTCVRLMALVQQWRVVLLASYLVVIGGLVVPVLAQGGASYSNIFRASEQLPAVVDGGALRAVSGSIPRDARLCISSDLMPFFGNRRSMLHPNWVNEANYILINRRRREDDAAKADEFLRTAPGSDAAAAHFKAEIADVLRGYGYDTALFDAVDRLIVEHKISVVRSEGTLSLYKTSD